MNEVGRLRERSLWSRLLRYYSIGQHAPGPPLLLLSLLLFPLSSFLFGLSNLSGRCILRVCIVAGSSADFTFAVKGYAILSPAISTAWTHAENSPRSGFDQRVSSNLRVVIVDTRTIGEFKIRLDLVPATVALFIIGNVGCNLSKKLSNDWKSRLIKNLANVTVLNLRNLVNFDIG